VHTPGTWSRALSATAAVTGSPSAVLAKGVTAVTLQLLTLCAQALPGPGSSDYGLLASNGASVALPSVTMVAGDATAEAPGSSGATGACGDNRQNGTGSAGGSPGPPRGLGFPRMVETESTLSSTRGLTPGRRSRRTLKA